ncbi:3-phosphoshikimate 1-carboxyvinyltransferase [Roseomonas gilardii subsp. gilardii]|uniref:3-phosphoshikimate 1-carboxyvinyltransferase n=1 Tax=Roseomonas gilardii TaxID=257708 RepID=UPI001FF78F0E|nr:3-phosphoshikimate 1-carboxyvinyltransferase [Roseomonas gilardii]UPG73756.1 3-phosphoshikimate 1-carboxyvinyltransferase [Roseomonas gilardii subsp. gilardii]
MLRPLRAASPAASSAAFLGQGLAGEIRVPGDGAIGHRALILAALAVGESRIEGLPEREDIRRTAAALRALGARVEQVGPGLWRVVGRGVGGLVEPGDILELGGSGDVARLFCGLLAGHPLFAVLTGDAALRRRPMGPVTGALAACGARFAARGAGFLPLAVEGARLALPAEHRLTLASAPVKSALLLAGLCARGVTRVEEPGSSHDHTENLLRHFGARLRVSPQGEGEGQGRLIELEGQPELSAAPVSVPGDPSLAGFPLVAALLVPGSRVTVRGVCLNPLRNGLLATLREMGGGFAVAGERVEAGEPVGDVTATHSPLRGVDVPAGRLAGAGALLAVAAGFATGTSRIRGLEAGELASLAALLAGNGVAAEAGSGELIIRGNGASVPGGGRLDSGAQPRLAMSALVLGLAAEMPVTVADSAGIDNVFPGFAEAMNRMAGGDAIAPL